ncbi:hypothetical protein QR680_014710 [Steinernema hermaphroditum]|uniref:Uncharacterized protein n=1 Tax=Steinernema hermaphroditum TaxID=289476 RepID=A0AA39M4J5_9BILA|nr:hypothetical protein QR680_014710 [Steinernema hermaphroditum]
MLLEIAFSENICIIILWIMTLFLIRLIFKRKSPRNMRKDSPTLFNLLINTIALAILAIFTLLIWVLVIGGVFLQVDKYAFFIIITNLLQLAVQLFYDLTTLRLFWERVLILLFPLRPLRLAKQILVVLSFTTGCAMVFFMFFIMLYPADISENFLPKGCYAFVCSNGRQHNYGPLFHTVLSILILTMGTCFVVLLARSKSFQNRNNRMFNKLTQYIFLIRLIADLTPAIIEIALAVTTTQSLGYYVGPIGAIGCVFEGFFSSAAYYYILSRRSEVKKQQPNSTNT